MEDFKLLNLGTYKNHDFNGSKIKFGIDNKKILHGIDLRNCVIISKNDFYILVAVMKCCQEHTEKARAFAESINSLLPPDLVPVQSEKH